MIKALGKKFQNDIDIKVLGENPNTYIGFLVTINKTKLQKHQKHAENQEKP